MSGAIKINSEKIKQIKKGDQGLRFNQGFIWVQLGDKDSSGCKLGISNIHTQNQRRERGCHVSAPHWATSACQCHVSAPHPCGSHLCHVSTPHWSTSPSPCHMAERSLTQSDLLETHGSISLVHITGHITISATWQLVNGPHQQLLHQTETHGSTA
jgi:hypothetical protein